MNDLNQINRANQDSVVASEIRKARAEGKFAVAQYAGLHLVSCIIRDTKLAADEALEALKKSLGASERAELLAPTA